MATLTESRSRIHEEVKLGPDATLNKANSSRLEQYSPLIVLLNSHRAGISKNRLTRRDVRVSARVCGNQCKSLSTSPIGDECMRTVSGNICRFPAIRYNEIHEFILSTAWISTSVSCQQDLPGWFHFEIHWFHSGSCDSIGRLSDICRLSFHQYCGRELRFPDRTSFWEAKIGSLCLACPWNGLIFVCFAMFWNVWRCWRFSAIRRVSCGWLGKENIPKIRSLHLNVARWTQREPVSFILYLIPEIYLWECSLMSSVVSVDSQYRHQQPITSPLVLSYGKNFSPNDEQLPSIGDAALNDASFRGILTMWNPWQLHKTFSIDLLWRSSDWREQVHFRSTEINFDFAETRNETKSHRPQQFGVIDHIQEFSVSIIARNTYQSDLS
jgi:hypothetical protein